MKISKDGKGRAVMSGPDSRDPLAGSFTITLPVEATRLEEGEAEYRVVIDEGQPSERVEMMTVRALRRTQARYGTPKSARLLVLWQKLKVAERITLDLKLSEFDRATGKDDEDPTRA